MKVTEGSLWESEKNSTGTEKNSTGSEKNKTGTENVFQGTFSDLHLTVEPIKQLNIAKSKVYIFMTSSSLYKYMGAYIVWKEINIITQGLSTSKFAETSKFWARIV
jgi:hypothetical protein